MSKVAHVPFGAREQHNQIELLDRLRSDVMAGRVRRVLTFTVYEDLSAATDWSSSGTMLAETIGALDILRHDLLNGALKR